MIDYERLAEAIRYYREAGFLKKEVPWIASSEIINITLPPGAKPTSLSSGHLVGSAEQSFLAMIAEKKLSAGSYVACTPCFRDETIDELHQKYFMKVELIETLDTSPARLQEIILICKTFFERYLPVEVIQVAEDQFDIVSAKSKIELGSYGLRNHPQIGAWIYATGCAEPRLSYTLNQEGFLV